MKALIQLSMLTLTLFAVACAKNNNDSSKKVANTPVATSQCMLSTGTISGSTCLYDYSRHTGFRNYVYDAYATNGAFSYGLCGCQSGYAPIYNNSWGLGCVQNTYVNSNNYIYYSWNSTNTQWVNIPQTAPSIPTTGSCVSDAMYACDPTLSNSCGINGSCLAVGGSRLGICQYRNGYNYYSNTTSGGWNGGYYYYNTFNR